MDVYFKKELTYTYKGVSLIFDVANELFSTFAIDHGTDMLLRHIVIHNQKTILDIGCGYGPIGICLAKTNPHAHVTMLDLNLLAVRYTNINIQKNNINNAVVLGSVGIESVKEKHFDLIVSNIPAKIGDNAIIQEFIVSPLKLLNPNGELWIVIVSALNRLIPKLQMNQELDVKLIRKRRGHSLYKIKKIKKP